jgi:hypothetical protein
MIYSDASPISHRSPRPPIDLQPRYVEGPAEPKTDLIEEHNRIQEGLRIWELVRQFAEATNQSSPMPRGEVEVEETFPVNERLVPGAELNEETFLQILQEVAQSPAEGWMYAPADADAYVESHSWATLGARPFSEPRF